MQPERSLHAACPAWPDAQILGGQVRSTRWIKPVNCRLGGNGPRDNSTRSKAQTSEPRGQSGGGRRPPSRPGVSLTVRSRGTLESRRNSERSSCEPILTAPCCYGTTSPNRVGGRRHTPDARYKWQSGGRDRIYQWPGRSGSDRRRVRKTDGRVDAALSAASRTRLAGHDTGVREGLRDIIRDPVHRHRSSWRRSILSADSRDADSTRRTGRIDRALSVLFPCGCSINTWSPLRPRARDRGSWSTNAIVVVEAVSSGTSTKVRRRMNAAVRRCRPWKRSRPPVNRVSH